MVERKPPAYSGVKAILAEAQRLSHRSWVLNVAAKDAEHPLVAETYRLYGFDPVQRGIAAEALPAGIHRRIEAGCDA